MQGLLRTNVWVVLRAVYASTRMALRVVASTVKPASNANVLCTVNNFACVAVPVQTLQRRL